MTINTQHEHNFLAENQPDNIARWDREKRYIYVNRVHEHTVGTAAANLIGKTIREAFTDGRYEPVEAAISQVVATGQPVMFVRQPVRFENGAIEIHDVTLIPERNTAGNIVSVLGVGRDMTQLYLAQDELKAKEKELRALAESTPGIMSSLYARPDGSICMPYASPNIEKLFGLRPQDVVDDATTLLSLNHPDDAQRVKDTIAESARTMTTWREEFRILHPTRGERWIESNTNPQPHPEGGVIWYGYLHDITERKQAEHQQKKLARALKLLSASSKLLVQAKNEQELLEDTCRFAVEIGGYLMAWVGFAENDEHKTVRPVAQSGYEDGYLDGINVSWAETERGQGPIGIAIRTGTTVINHDFRTNSSLAFWREAAIKRGFRSSIALPLVSNGLTLGSLNIYSVELDAFRNNEEVELLQELADNLALGVGMLRTRAEKERMEKNLEKREREYRILVENNPDSIYRYDRDYRRLYVNPSVCRRVGKSAQELLGSTIDDGQILVAEQGRIVMDHIGRVFDRGEPESFIVEVIEQDGMHNDYLMTIVPEHDAEGRVATVLGFTRNVTEIRRLERLQSQYFALAPGAFATTFKRADGSYVMPFVSEGVRELLDVEPEAVMRDFMVLPALTHPDDIAMTFRKAEESARDLTPYRIEYRINHPHKGVRWIECNALPQRLADGGTRWDGFYHDITERKNAQHRIELLDHAINQSSDAVYLIDEQHRFVYVNNTACRSLGYSQEELLSMSPPDIDPNVTHEIISELMKTTISSGFKTPFESCHRTRNGRIFPVEIVASAVEFSGAKYSLTLVRDITERKQAEQELIAALEFSEGVINAIPDLLFEVNADGRYLNVWARNMELLAAQKEMLLGKTVQDVLAPEAAAVAMEALREADKHGISLGKVIRVDQPNGESWFELSVSKKMASAQFASTFLVLSRDITTRVKMETMLSESETRFRNNFNLLQGLLESTNEVRVFALDRQYCYLAFNTAHRKFAKADWGADIELGKNWLDDVNTANTKEFRDFCRRCFDRMLAGESFSTESMEKYLRENGQEDKQYFYNYGSPIQNEKGEVIGLTVFSVNITKRKSMEAEIVAREQEFHALVEMAPEPIFRFSPDGRRIYVNAAAERITGIPAETLLGSTSMDEKIVSYDEGTAAVALIRRICETGMPGEIEVENVGADGKHRYFHCRYAPEFGADGKVKSVFSIGHDITERKLAEQKLKESLALNEGVINAIPDILFEMDRNGKYLNMWTHTPELLAGQKDLSLGNTIHDMLSPESAGIVMESLREAEKNETSFGKQIRIDSPQRSGWFELSVSKNSGSSRSDDTFLVLSRDVTVRKQMEADLNASRNFLDCVINSVSDPIFVKDRQHRFALVNDALCSLVGHPRETLLDKSDYDFCLKDQADEFWAKDELVFDSGQININEERFTTASGEEHYIQTKKTLFVAGDGQPMLVGVIRDITDFNHYQQAREAALTEAMRLAKARNEFISHMSHELRTPLNGILGYTQIMQSDTTLSVRHADALNAICQSGEHLLALVEDILDLARIEAGRFNIDSSNISLATFLRAVTDIVSIRAQQKGIEFITDLAANLPEGIRGDEKRLRQVLLNLLSNAVRFTERGRVVLHVSMNYPTRLAFAIEDTGVGIAANELETIFHPFEQSVDVQQRFGGTGLGLSISRQLVRLMGGDIAVESCIGKGSTFSFELELPAVQIDPAALPTVSTGDEQAELNCVDESAESLIIPPAEEMKALHRLAQLGLMRDIVQFAEHIAQMDPRYQTFALRVRRMAEGFQSKAVLTFVEGYLHDSGA